MGEYHQDYLPAFGSGHVLAEEQINEALSYVWSDYDGPRIPLPSSEEQEAPFSFSDDVVENCDLRWRKLVDRTNSFLHGIAIEISKRQRPGGCDSNGAKQLGGMELGSVATFLDGLDARLLTLENKARLPMIIDYVYKPQETSPNQRRPRRMKVEGLYKHLGSMLDEKVKPSQPTLSSFHQVLKNHYNTSSVHKTMQREVADWGKASAKSSNRIALEIPDVDCDAMTVDRFSSKGDSFSWQAKDVLKKDSLRLSSALTVPSGSLKPMATRVSLTMKTVDFVEGPPVRYVKKNEQLGRETVVQEKGTTLNRKQSTMSYDFGHLDNGSDNTAMSTLTLSEIVEMKISHAGGVKKKAEVVKLQQSNQVKGPRSKHRSDKRLGDEEGVILFIGEDEVNSKGKSKSELGTMLSLKKQLSTKRASLKSQDAREKDVTMYLAGVMVDFDRKSSRNRVGSGDPVALNTDGVEDDTAVKHDAQMQDNYHHGNDAVYAPIARKREVLLPPQKSSTVSLKHNHVKFSSFDAASN